MEQKITAHEILSETETMLESLESISVKNDRSIYYQMMAHGCLSLSQRLIDQVYEYRTPTKTMAAFDVAFTWVKDSWAK